MKRMFKAAVRKLEACVLWFEDRICGVNPFLTVFDHQFLGVRYRRQRVADVLSALQGKKVLDIGCGAQPYRRYLNNSCQYVGIDVYPSHPQTVVVSPDSPWPNLGTFDLILCTEVLEHVQDLQRFVSELDATLRPGGTLVATAPFLYMIHDKHDYRRLAIGEYENIFPYQLDSVTPYGRFGTVIVILSLNWLYFQLRATKVGHGIYLVASPLRALLNCACNLAGMLLDAIDRSNAFYGGSLAIMTKPQQASDRHDGGA